MLDESSAIQCCFQSLIIYRENGGNCLHASGHCLVAPGNVLVSGLILHRGNGGIHFVKLPPCPLVIALVPLETLRPDSGLILHNGSTAWPIWLMPWCTLKCLNFRHDTCTYFTEAMEATASMPIMIIAVVPQILFCIFLAGLVVFFMTFLIAHY